MSEINPCNVLNITDRGLPVDCADGIEEFSNDCSAFIAARQTNDHVLSEREGKALAAKAKQEKAKCLNDGSMSSCGFANVYEQFVRMFGEPTSKNFRKSEASTLHFKRFSNGTIVIPIGKKGGNEEAILDTGSSVSVFSLEYVKAHANNFEPFAMVDGYEQWIYKVLGLPIYVGHETFRPQLGISSSFLDQMEGSDTNHRTVAMLGADFLLSTPYLIDQNTSTITFHPNINNEIAKGGWIKLPFKLFMGESSDFGISVLLKLNGIEGYWNIDTGTDGSSLTSYCHLTEMPDLKITGESTYLSISGPMRQKKSSGNILSIGETALNDVTVSIWSSNDPNDMAVVRSGGCGNLGQDVMKRFKMIYDPFSFSLYFKPLGGKFENPVFRGIDFMPKRMDGSLVIPREGAGKMSTAAGVRSGDVITEINGKKANDLSMMEIMEILNYPPDGKIELKILRDGEEKTINIDFSK